jgi:hypothetical protein
MEENKITFFKLSSSRYFSSSVKYLNFESWINPISKFYALKSSSSSTVVYIADNPYMISYLRLAFGNF